MSREGVMSNWENNSIQFPRLLAEIQQVGLTDEQYRKLELEMDLRPKDIDWIFGQAIEAWDEIKSEVTT